MTSRAWLRSGRFAMFADACVLTAGIFVACLAVGGGTVTLLGRLGGPVVQVVQAILGPVFTFAAVFAGPYLTWRLHGRRITGAAVLGAFFGIAATVVVVGAFVALILTIGRPLMGDEAPAVLGLLALFGAGMLAVMVSGVAASVADLRGARKTTPLDTARLVCAGLAFVFAAAMGAVLVYLPKSEIIEALPFMLVFALIGGMMAVGASVLTEPRRDTHADTGDTAA